MVTTYTENISSNGSKFFDSWVLDLTDIQGKNLFQWGARLLNGRTIECYYVFLYDVPIHSK